MNHETGDDGSEVPVIATLLCKQWDLQGGALSLLSHHSAGKQGKLELRYGVLPASAPRLPHRDGFCTDLALLLRERGSVAMMLLPKA